MLDHSVYHLPASSPTLQRKWQLPTDIGRCNYFYTKTKTERCPKSRTTTKNNDNCPQTLATVTLISYTETNSHRQIDKDKDKLSKTKWCTKSRTTTNSHRSDIVNRRLANFCVGKYTYYMPKTNTHRKQKKD